MQETILVLGGTGYIGSHTAHLLAQSAYNVIILDNFVHNQPFEHPWATVVRGDYADRDLLGRICATHHISAVMHFAGLISVSESVHKPALYYKNNVLKTIALLDVMAEHAIQTIIFSSSAAVYGQPTRIPIPEDHSKNPINPYGRTKLIIEQLLQDYANAYGLRFVALRYFNAAGAQPEYNLGEYHVPETHIIPLAIQAAREHKPFMIFGNNYPTPDGTCVRDYLHVADIAHAHLLALYYLNNGGVSACINLGTGTGYSVLDIVNTVSKVVGSQLAVSYRPMRTGDPAQLVADPTRAQEILQWHARNSTIETIIGSAYQAILKKHSIYEQAIQR